jgi:hypothetical protein
MIEIPGYGLVIVWFRCPPARSGSELVSVPACPPANTQRQYKPMRITSHVSIRLSSRNRHTYKYSRLSRHSPSAPSHTLPTQRH